MLHLYDQSGFKRKHLAEKLGYANPSSMGRLFRYIGAELPRSDSVYRREALQLRMDYKEYLCAKVLQYGSVISWVKAEGANRQQIHMDFLREGICCSSRKFVVILGHDVWLTGTQAALMLKRPIVLTYHNRAKKNGTSFAEEVAAEFRSRGVQVEVVSPLGMPRDVVAKLAPFRTTGVATKIGKFTLTAAGRKLKVVK